MSAGRPWPRRRATDAAAAVVPRSALDEEAPRIAGRGGPLEGHACRIEQAVRACTGWKAADRQRVEGAGIVAVQQSGVVRIAPGEDAAVHTARGLLPFELGGKPPGAPGLGREPGRVGIGVVVRNHDHGMVFAPRRRNSLRPRVAAGALVRDGSAGSRARSRGRHRARGGLWHPRTPRTGRW